MEVYRGTGGGRAACNCGGVFATGIGLDRDRAFYPVVTIVTASYYPGNVFRYPVALWLVGNGCCNPVTRLQPCQEGACST